MSGSPQADAVTGIVIVTYNRLEHTKLCVGSIVAHTPEPHELLFVDNGSTDGTLGYLQERFGPDRVLANASNEGFIEAANRGMAALHTDYTLLLNNDTTVTPGWLGALHAAVERTPDVGIASGKIVGPDGRIQLAGAYIAFDGSARMLGEGLSPEDPSISTEREVCYVGGHCMLIKRSVPEAIGLLNEEYGFGYHEDTDYCYRARQAGFKVVYTPACVVHHQLFGTPLPERQQIIAGNQQLFLNRWRKQLFLERFISPRIEFRADRGELPVGQGWYAAETEYTCCGDRATCYLSRPSRRDAVLELVAQAPHPDLVEMPLRADVNIDGRLAGHAFFTTPWEQRQLFFPVPESGDGPLRVDLSVDRVWEPEELFRDGRDPRRIGLAVSRMAVGSLSEAARWAAEGVGVENSLTRLRDHLSYLQNALSDKDAFYTRELEGKERLIAKLQGNLERYHAMPPFKLYFAIKKLLA